MTRAIDVIVIGGGPAGLSAASSASRAGLSTILLDESPSLGGQIYRNLDGISGHSASMGEVLGRAFMEGLAVIDEFRASKAEFLPRSRVWSVSRDLRVAYSLEGVSREIEARHLVFAPGAMERPMPIPGWTLPGVMTVGAGQGLLKGGTMVPSGEAVVAGKGPLLLLYVAQLVRAGCPPKLVLDLTQTRNYARAAPYMHSAFLVPEYLTKGVSLLRELKAGGVRVERSVRGIRARGDGRVGWVDFVDARSRPKSEKADLLLLHA